MIYSRYIVENREHEKSLQVIFSRQLGSDNFDLLAWTLTFRDFFQGDLLVFRYVTNKSNTKIIYFPRTKKLEHGVRFHFIRPKKIIQINVVVRQNVTSIYADQQSFSLIILGT